MALACSSMVSVRNGFALSVPAGKEGVKGGWGQRYNVLRADQQYEQRAPPASVVSPLVPVVLSSSSMAAQASVARAAQDSGCSSVIGTLCTSSRR